MAAKHIIHSDAYLTERVHAFTLGTDDGTRTGSSATWISRDVCGRTHVRTRARMHRALLSAWILSDWFIMYEWRARKSRALTPRADLDLSNIRAFIYLNDFIILEENEISSFVPNYENIWYLYITYMFYAYIYLGTISDITMDIIYEISFKPIIDYTSILIVVSLPQY